MAKKRRKILVYVEWWFSFAKNMAEFVRKNPYPSNTSGAVDTDFEEVDPDEGQHRPNPHGAAGPGTENDQQRTETSSPERDSVD